MKIYFAGSIRCGRPEDDRFLQIIEHLKTHGEVLTEHVGKVDVKGETGLTDKEIHDRDLSWVKESNVFVAEITVPSLGVGYEIAKAIEYGKRVLCLHTNDRTSAMIGGCDELVCKKYGEIGEAKEIIDGFLN